MTHQDDGGYRVRAKAGEFGFDLGGFASDKVCVTLRRV
jgi:hypothetical protein